MKKFYKIFRSFIYRLFSKKLLFSIILFLLIIMLKSNVFAYSISDLSSVTFAQIPASAKTAIENINEYKSGNYNYILWESGDNYVIWFVNKSDGGFWVQSVSGNEMFIYRQNHNKTTYYYSINKETFTVSNRQSTSGTYQRIPITTLTNYVFDSNTIVTIGNNSSNIFYMPIINPYISQTDNELSYMNIPYITLYGGSVPTNNVIIFSIVKVTGNETGDTIFQLSLNNNSILYKSNNGNYYYEIPVALFRNLLQPGFNYRYYIYWSDGLTDYSNYRLTLFLGVSNQEQTDINITNGLNSINTSINETNQKLDSQTNILNDTNEFLKDDNFNSSDLSIPSDNTNDITENGINNIFTQIYNGFTSGEATNIDIPIPFTNKSITINYNLTSNVLNSTGFGWLKMIIEAFWWYIISSFIVKDISKKINKIKSGDFENIETNNIKEDML